MCVALAAFENNIATVFDSSNKLILIKPPFYNLDNAESIVIKNNTLNELFHLLKINNVKILICGAISGCTRRSLEAQQIQVIPWITGDIESVIEAFKSNKMFPPSFIMPGCSRYRRRWQQQF